MVRDVLEEVEKGRLRPVQVVHHDDERTRSGERLEEPADRPEDLLAGSAARVVESQCLGHPLGDQLGLLLPGQRRPGEPHGDRRRGLVAGIRPGGACDVADDSGQGPVGDPLTVGQAVAADDRRTAGELRRELLEQPRLPDAGVAENGQHMAGPRADGVVEHRRQRGARLLTTDER